MLRNVTVLGIASFLTVSLGAFAAHGQDVAALRAGEAVRIRTRLGTRVRGTLVQQFRDSLIVDITKGRFVGVLTATVRSDGEQLIIPLAEIERVEAIRCCGTPVHGAFRGAEYGALIGLGFGLAGAAVGCLNGDLDCNSGSGVEGRAVRFTLVRMGVGALVGGIIGSFMPPARWVRVSTVPVTLDVGYDLAGARIGFVLGGNP